MTVVHEPDDACTVRKTCSICECEAHRYPYLEYMNALVICHECCERNLDGLIADLIEVDANVRLQRHMPYHIRLKRSFPRATPIHGFKPTKAV